jgi:hypothetical protein
MPEYDDLGRVVGADAENVYELTHSAPSKGVRYEASHRNLI